MFRHVYEKDKRQRRQTSRKKHDKEDLKSGTYILEHTRAFFTGRSDEPWSGAACFEPSSGAARLSPAVSGAAPLRPAASIVAILSPVRSGVVPPAPAMAGVGPWPPPATRDT
jgi:hypothetical protein